MLHRSAPFDPRCPLSDLPAVQPLLRWSASPASPNPSLVIQHRTITAAMAGEKAIGICTNEFSSDNPSSSRATKIVGQASPKVSNRYANTPLVFIVIGRCAPYREEQSGTARACGSPPGPAADSHAVA